MIDYNLIRLDYASMENKFNNKLVHFSIDSLIN